MPRHFIDELDDQLAFERSESFGGGMDQFTRAALLAPDQWQFGQNLLVWENFEAGTRYGADLLGGNLAAAIQGLLFITTPAVDQLVAGAKKKLYARAAAGAWAELAGYQLSDDAAPFAAAQGVDKALFSDGAAALAILDPSTNTWTICGTGDNDPPTGATVLCWHTGRMFAAGFAGGTPSKENDAIWVSNRLAYGTGQWNKITRQFRVGGGEGDPIRALASMQSFNLCVLKQNSVWIVSTDPTQEPDGFSANQPVEALSYGVGCVGRRAWCNYGNDLLFLARDGVRSVQRMISASGQYQLAAPLSQPMQPWIDRINWAYAHTTCAVKYKELALFAVPIDNALSPNTVLVWHGRLGKWIGVWTGWTPNCFAVSRFNGVPQLVFGDSAGAVKGWKDSQDPTADTTYTEDGAAIASKLWTRSMLFGEPVNYKNAYHAEVRLSTANALLDVTLVADDAELKTWSVDARQTGVGLPVDLPFDLASNQPTVARQGLRSLPQWNEAYLRLESDSGWWRVRNFTLSAFLKALANQ